MRKLYFVGVGCMFAALILLVLAILTESFDEFMSGHQATTIGWLAVIGFVLTILDVNIIDGKPDALYEVSKRRKVN